MVRPIDVQQIVLQTNPVEKIQQVQQRFPEMQQQYLERQAELQKQTQMSQVQEKRKPEEVRINPDEQRRGAQEGKRERFPRREAEKNQADGDSTLTGTKVDIKV
jgi:hypothetical protein